MDNSKKNTIIISGLLIIVAVVLISTYAFFNQERIQDTDNVAATGCFELTFEELSEEISLTNQFPVTNEKGLEQTPYIFKLTNICDYASRYNVTLETKAANTLASSSIRAALDDKHKLLIANTTSTPTLSGYDESYTLTNGWLASGDSITHELKLWVDKDTPETEMDKIFNAKLVIVAVAGEDNRLATLVLNQFGGTENIAIAPTVLFSNSTDAGEAMMYKMNDDYGVSYFYRGAKNLLSNNILFAGFQWKIVRINGDGSIRLIYNGTEAQFNSNREVNDTGANTQIGTSVWNASSNTDNKYSGYMYGGIVNEASTSREQSVTNETDSTIKTVVDAWYLANIETKGTSVTNKISDTLYCNDRTLQSGTGYSSSVTYYKTNNRLETNKVPILTCPDQNDRFTVNDDAIGNASLTYPIGLLSVDEMAVVGGAHGKMNPNGYLQTNTTFWSMSPNRGFAGVSVWVTINNGRLFSNNNNDVYGIRPVINLNYNVQVTGVGSATRPFRVI